MLGTILGFTEHYCGIICLKCRCNAKILNSYCTLYNLFKGGDLSFLEELMGFPVLSPTFHATITTGLTQVLMNF